MIALGTMVDGLAPDLAAFDVPGALELRVRRDRSRDRMRLNRPNVRGFHRPVVVAGPGVFRFDAVDALQRFAAAGNLPVANTWGAKGVFQWDSPHHMGTFGLQRDDAALLGLDQFDVIFEVGTDPEEWAPSGESGGRTVIPVEPMQLATMTKHLRAAPAIPSNDLYAALSAVAQPGYVNDKVPRHPARAIADLKAALPAGGIVTADPGWVGLWVARCFPTDEPGSVVVPARRAPGIAAALALAARMHGLPAVAITSGLLDEATATVLELARARGVDLPVVAWTEGGSVPDLPGALAQPGVSVTEHPVDRTDTQLLIDAAGPVVAWGGLGNDWR